MFHTANLILKDIFIWETSLTVVTKHWPPLPARLNLLPHHFRSHCPICLTNCSVDLTGHQDWRTIPGEGTCLLHPPLLRTLHRGDPIHPCPPLHTPEELAPRATECQPLVKKWTKKNKKRKERNGENSVSLKDQTTAKKTFKAER